MTRKDRKKTQKKRRDQHQRQRERERNTSLAYHGNKYKTAELVGVHFQTEVAIYEAFMLSGRTLTDHDVRRELEKLVWGIRDGTLKLPLVADSAQPDQAQPEDRQSPAEAEQQVPNIIAWNVQSRWTRYFDNNPFPGRDNMVGVLRTILGSIEVWGNINPASRGYLWFLQGFMGDAGVRVQAISADSRVHMIDDSLAAAHG